VVWQGFLCLDLGQALVLFDAAAEQEYA
jgi:hypothetical protein